MPSLDFFRTTGINEQPFFDEGPAAVPPSGSLINTSSIDTSAIDAFRQGVELTQQKHFDAGIAKISAGEPGHELRRNRFGMDRNFRPDPTFQDLDYFNPLTFLLAQDALSSIDFNVITYPIITSDNDQIENYTFDGVIEPFSIRPVASFFSIELPFEAHEPRGAVMGANTDPTNASDQALTVDYYNVQLQQVGYLDLIDMVNGSGSFPLNGFFPTDKAHLAPFSDSRLVRNTTQSTTYDSDLLSALSLMSGSTDNYVRPGQRSAAAGWDYDRNASVGTDSLAFGGMCY